MPAETTFDNPALNSLDEPTDAALKVSNPAEDLLARVHDPAALRELDPQQLPQLAEQIRQFLVDSTAQTGGHLAPGLGTVELTLALHYVLDTPHDRLVWDIGHQAYPHKVITGRREQFHTLRQLDGLSGFLKREESEYDTFGAGHSSTSISAALGMAVAAKQQGIDREVVAIIGDGAMTAGMAFEALNNAGDLDANLLVVLNDNEMSISPNVGALSNYLSRILSGRAYTTVREGSKTVLSTLPPPLKHLARRWEEHMKGMVMPSTLFEELGFNYIGPVDGHDIDTLVRVLKNLREMTGPRFLHIVTRKGKGFEPAEGDPCVFHGISPFDPATGKVPSGSKSRNYTHVFGDWLCDMANADDKLVAITPAMREGSGMVAFSEKFPDRYFDVGIAEQHALTFAAGLACEGVKPVVAIYSTFLQRAYDQLIHDVCIQDLDVLLAIDRAGLVGADGATHHGSFDLSFLACVPNMLMMAPADEAECRTMLTTGYQHKGPAAVRYPRGAGTGAEESPELSPLDIGKAEIRRQSASGKVALLAWGNMVAIAEKAAMQIDASVVNMRFIKPLDKACVQQMAREHELLVTLEDNAIAGGAGSLVNQYLQTIGDTTPVLNLGLPDDFVEQGTQDELFTRLGLDANGIKKSINTFSQKHLIDL